MLFFELFNPVESAKERMHALSGLRHRILPMDLLQGRPQEAAFVLSLLHPDPAARPTAARLSQPGCLSALQESICRPSVSFRHAYHIISTLLMLSDLMCLSGDRTYMRSWWKRFSG